MVYNPLHKAEPKTKPIFKVIKTNSRKGSVSGSDHSSNDPRYLADIERQADQMNLFSSGEFSIPTNLNLHKNNESSHLGIPGFTVPIG